MITADQVALERILAYVRSPARLDEWDGWVAAIQTDKGGDMPTLWFTALLEHIEDIAEHRD